MSFADTGDGIYGYMARESALEDELAKARKEIHNRNKTIAKLRNEIRTLKATLKHQQNSDLRARASEGR